MWNPKFLATETSSQLPALGRDKRMWMSSRQMGLQQEAFSLSPGRWAGEGVREGEWGAAALCSERINKKDTFLAFHWEGPFPLFSSPFWAPFIERLLSSQVFYPRDAERFPVSFSQRGFSHTPAQPPAAALRSSQLAGFCCFLVGFENSFALFLPTLLRPDI